MPELSVTNWSGISVIDFTNMASGLDVIESPAHLKDPNSTGTHLFQAEAGIKNADGIKRTHNDVLFAVPKLKAPGEAFEYGSANTQILGMPVERIIKKPFSDIVSERIWSKIGSEGDTLICLSTDGQALIHGCFSSRLRDFARYGMLYTSSWNKVAGEPVISAQMLKRIQKGGNPENFYKGVSGPRFARHATR